MKLNSVLCVLVGPVSCMDMINNAWISKYLHFCFSLHKTPIIPEVFTWMNEWMLFRAWIRANSGPSTLVSSQVSFDLFQFRHLPALNQLGRNYAGFCQIN